MKAYELLYFIDPALNEESRAALTARIDSTFQTIEATVDSVNEWGKRKLAFEVEDLTEGEYTLINFHANPENIAELDRVLHITDTVIRYMIVRLEDQE